MSFCLYNKKNITRWLEDMNFIFLWQKQYFTQKKTVNTRNIHGMLLHCEEKANKA